MKLTELLKKKQNTEVYKINMNKTVRDAVEMFNKLRIGSLVVEDDNSKLQGIVTERDVLYKCDSYDGNPKDMKISDIMTPKEELFIATKDERLNYAMRVMTNKRVRHLPVIDEDQLLGILSIGDILKEVLEESEAEVKVLREYIKNPYGINI
ncbi:CBS domain-containing protein [bacterium]|nr:CBS domain-containing protein [bacterium]